MAAVILAMAGLAVRANAKTQRSAWLFAKKILTNAKGSLLPVALAGLAVPVAAPVRKNAEHIARSILKNVPVEEVAEVGSAARAVAVVRRSVLRIVRSIRRNAAADFLEVLMNKICRARPKALLPHSFAPKMAEMRRLILK